MASVFAMGVDLTRRQLLDAFPHNSALEILASFGLVGGILLLGCGAVWAVRAWKVRNCSPEQWPMGAGVLILLSHALLEFPLWYLYFMLLFGLMLGAATSSEHEKGTMRFPVRVVTVGLAIYGLVAASYAFVDHERAARAIWLGNVARAEQGAASEGALANLASLVPQLTLFRIVGERELDQFLKLSADDERVRSSNERMLRNIPDPPTIYRQILIESYDGRPDKARQLIRRLLVFWPKLSDAYLEQLHERVREEPIALKALGPILDEEMIERPDAKATATHRGIWFGD
jgi:hypothetical protein